MLRGLAPLSSRICSASAPDIQRARKFGDFSIVPLYSSRSKVATADDPAGATKILLFNAKPLNYGHTVSVGIATTISTGWVGPSFGSRTDGPSTSVGRNFCDKFPTVEAAPVSCGLLTTEQTASDFSSVY